jgi:bifunctional NMN adenylyltransferase/nudix hydrolase
MKTQAETAEVGVLVGRFQTANLHEAHKELIQRTLKSHPRVIIFLGLSPCRCTYNNPLDFAARKAMIEKDFPDMVEVHYIEDVASDEVWSHNLDKQISRIIGPTQKVILYGSKDSFIPHYSGKYPVVDLVPTTYISAKELRKSIGIKSKTSQEFREGVIWCVENQFPSVHPTVDIAIFNETFDEMLLAKKPNETHWRFVGGFADVNSPSYEYDAKREVMEETGIEVSDMVYIGSTLINDWRYKHERNKIKTLLFATKYIFGAPKAQDDIAELKWFKLVNLDEHDFVQTHVPLYKMLKEKEFRVVSSLRTEINPKE